MTHVAIAQGELCADLLEEQRLEKEFFISNSRLDFMTAVTRYFSHSHSLSEEELDERRFEVS